MAGTRRLTQIEILKQQKAEKASQGLNLEPALAREIGLSGFEDEATKRLIVAQHFLQKGKVATLRPVLPAMLQIKGQPYTLADHFPFEPFFRTRMPQVVLLKTGRQVSKSTSLAAQGIVFSNSLNYFSTLYVTPLFEMIRRFSHNYVRQFLETSPVANLFIGTNTTNQILQRSFKNGSAMYFSYAFLDAERTRGIPADKNVIDEVQDMNHDFLQIIHETLSGSPWGLKQYAGTPKSLENTIHKLWTDSSQAEWVMKCRTAGCGHWNVPCLTHDLVDMIDHTPREISERYPGVVCAKCRKPGSLNPREGRWVHADPSKRWAFAGYHVPQFIMPMHYANPEKWAVLVGKMQGKGNTAANVFFNEVCGESYDLGSKLVTVTDLKDACVLPWKNEVEDAEKHLGQYLYRVLSVDWGGGGGRVKGSSAKKDGTEQRERTSFTVLTVMGIRPDGKVDVIWGHRSLKTHDFEYEARLCLAAMRRFKCSHLVHDYNGAGAVREVFIRQSGFPLSHIIGVAYHPSAKKNFINFHPATDDHPRDWWSVDKSRSLGLCCEMIKQGYLRFFQYDHKSNDDPGLVHDWLALVEEKTSSRLGTDVYIITKNPNASDDFAQAVNIGTAALCHMANLWPNIAEAAELMIPADLIPFIAPAKIQWDDI